MQPRADGLRDGASFARKLKKSLLGHVFSQRRIACHAASRGKHHPGMMLNKGVELRGIAGVMVTLEVKEVGVHDFNLKVVCRRTIMQNSAGEIGETGRGGLLAHAATVLRLGVYGAVAEQLRYFGGDGGGVRGETVEVGGS